MQVTDNSKYQAYTLNVKASVSLSSTDDLGNQNMSEETKKAIKNGDISGKSISSAYLLEFSMKVQSYSSSTLDAQSNVFDINKIKELTDNLKLDEIGYTGKPISDLTQDEAKKLVGEDGFFGVAKTSERLADFVLSGSGNDVEKLKAGREGITKGFKEAESLWGDKLPDISYETLDKALAKIDKKIEELGGKALDVQA